MKQVKRYGVDGVERYEGGAQVHGAIASAVGQSAGSRYRDQAFIIDDNTGSTYHETFRKRNNMYRSPMSYFVITPAYEYRPDLLAYERYGFARYAFDILEVNDMDWMSFRRGVTIMVPSPEDIAGGV